MSTQHNSPTEEVQSLSGNQQDLAAWDRIEADLLSKPGQQWNPAGLQHLFAPGVYIRQIFMKGGEGHYVLGAQHRQEHFNIILQGRVSVFMDGEWSEIVGPCTIKSGADVRKLLLVHEDTIWQTIHANPDNETDVKKLEDRYFVYSQNYLKLRAAWEAQQANETPK